LGRSEKMRKIRDRRSIWARMGWLERKKKKHQMRIELSHKKSKIRKKSKT
jgi:hypothetical protein